jgi:hypothetical protein
MTMDLFFLIKIGCKEHILELYDKGVIFMNNIDYFIQYEDKELRGDKSEGLSVIAQDSKLQLFYNGKELGHAESAKLKVRGHSGNIYSLIAITSNDSPGSFHIDERNKKFGDSFVVILNVKKFMKRIENKFKEMNFEHEYGLVRYYDPKK